MPEPPLFSVVVPTHDRADLLAKAVASVVVQTVTDFEVVVVDDGAAGADPRTDDPRVRLVRQPRGGAASARNAGVMAARGRYVTFLDDDDEFTPDRLELALRGLEKAPIALCWKAEVASREIRWSRALYGDCAGTLLEATVPQLGSAAVRRDLVLPMDHRLQVSEDVEWWIRMSMQGPVHTVGEVGYLIRDHEGTRLRDQVLARLAARVRLVEAHRQYFVEHPAAAAYQWRRAGGMAQSLGLHGRALRYYSRSAGAVVRQRVSGVLDLSRLARA